MAKIAVEIFVPYIVRKLRKTNPHLAAAHDESAAVLGGAVVHIPQEGAKPAVVKNRSSFPATAKKRGDSSITYALDVYTTDPTHVEWKEVNEVSYDKIDSVLNDHVLTLVESVGDDAFYNWVHGKKTAADGAITDVEIPASHILKTTGSETEVNAADSQTGKRLALTEKDLARAQAAMNKAGVPKDGRFVCIESYMYQQLIDSLSANQMAAFQQTADLANGVVGRLHGFSILERASVLRFNAAGKPMLPSATPAATDNIGALAWQKDCVTIARGDIKQFDERENPMYYGDVFSALVKAGGRARYENFDGVIAIVQGSASTSAE